MLTSEQRKANRRAYDEAKRKRYKTLAGAPSLKTGPKEEFKTVGGRGKYWQCDKAKKQPFRLGVFAFAPSRGTKNGRPIYSYV